MKLTYRNLHDAIRALLLKRFPDISWTNDDGEREPKADFDNVEKKDAPCFYIELAPQRVKTWDAVTAERSIDVDVHYFGQEDEDGNVSRAELYDMGDALDALFRPVFYVADRAITINDAEITIVDEVLHYIFKLEFADVFTDEEAPAEVTDVMQELTLNIDKEEKPNGK